MTGRDAEQFLESVMVADLKNLAINTGITCLVGIMVYMYNTCIYMFVYM